MDIHRRANLLPERFTAIVEGVVGLVEDGYNVNFVELNATGQALENYGYRERLLELDAVRDRLESNENLYGRNVGQQIMEFLDDCRDDPVFEWAHERAGFAGDDRAFDYL